ncbi:kinase [Streptococcus gallolyticus]|uniref:Kinase n=1 Tax=Streptococcus gallolyticus TaxID=315405 RepID=A0A368UG25_9STRE|nr:kinase [Streptococcus gallolyticus]
MLNEIYTYNINLKSLPLVGFKIHISATPYNFKAILRVVLPYLNKKHLNYKYISKQEDILKNFSIFEETTNSGKLITIYPENTQQFKEILNDLYKIIPNSTDGIYILSDHPYRDSNNIFYRYGFFKEIPEYSKNGILTLTGPNGEIWQDYPKTYFDLPSWIDDIQDINLQKTSYLSKNYRIDQIIHSSNGGNIYRGVATKTNRLIVMKEAKPYILFFDNVEKRSLRKNEYQISQQINNYIPTPLEKVQEWINTYYIYEYIDGINLTSYTTPLTIFSYEITTEKENSKKFEQFLAVINNLFQLVDYFHENNVILNDIHADNFLVNSKKIYFIDLETSYEYKGKPIVGIYNNNSLKDWNNIDGKVSDCHKIGNMILYLIGRLQIKSKLTNELNILNNLLQFYGIESNIEELISYLFTPSASIKTAKKILKQIYVNVKYNDKFLINKKLTTLKKQLISLDLSTANLSLIEYIYSNNPNYKKYLKYLDNPIYLRYFIDSEKNFGLEGLAGILILLNKSSCDESIILYAINKLINNIIDTKNGKMVKINNNTASPYLSSGSAGVIKALLNINYQKYQKVIEELSNGITASFAQRPNYWNGMLGIADTLLDVYAVTHNKNYINFTKTLIINSSYYLDSKRLSKNEFIQVFNHLDYLTNIDWS